MGDGQPAGADLTARARIRDAALLQFAERGVKGATFRGIAEAAGVSVGLVQHHFGSKETLRQACDEFAIDTIRRTKQEVLAGEMDDPGFLPVALKIALPVQRYVARALVDGSSGAAGLFDDTVAFTEELLSRGTQGVSMPRTDDLHAYAAVVTGMSFGLIVLHEHLSRSLGANTLTTEGYPRMMLAMLDINNDTLLQPETLAQARAALRAIQALPRDGERPPEDAGEGSAAGRGGDD